MNSLQLFFMTVSHSAQMLLKLEKCIPISHVTLEILCLPHLKTSIRLYISRHSSAFSSSIAIVSRIISSAFYPMPPLRRLKPLIAD